jgi:hypothetical protein
MATTDIAVGAMSLRACRVKAEISIFVGPERYKARAL